MVAWVFFVILLGASYTAGLSSFLTANSLSPPTQDIISLRESGKSLGYRRGSIVHDYLTTRFRVPENQLKAIRAVSDFVNNITKGPDQNGVLAIVDELPYVNIILSNLSCDFAITGPQLTSEGFGFVRDILTLMSLYLPACLFNVCLSLSCEHGTIGFRLIENHAFTCLLSL